MCLQEGAHRGGQVVTFTQTPDERRGARSFTAIALLDTHNPLGYLTDKKICQKLMVTCSRSALVMSTG